MLSDILRAPSKAGEAGKPLSKSEEGGLAAEPRAEPEHCQTPNSARRIRPKYSREGKSQSLILLSGEDEDALGVRHDKVSTVTVTEPLLLTLLFGLLVGAAPAQGCWWWGRPGTAGGCEDSGAAVGDVPAGLWPCLHLLGGTAGVGDGCCGCCGGCCVPGRAVSVLQKRQLEKSEGELPASFEQRMQVMLHRIGVTKGPAAEGKKQQVGSGSNFRMDPAPKGQEEAVVRGMGVPWKHPALCRHCPRPLSCHLTLCKRTNMWAPMLCMASVCPSFLGMHPPPAATPEPGSTLPSATHCP